MGWSRRQKKAHNSIRTSTPGPVIDLPKPPDHIIVDIKPVKRIKWPHHLNLSPNSNLIRIPIGLTSWCKKKVRVGTQESVTYYAHAVDLAFAITVWKCQGGTFDYIIALLEYTPGSRTLTFEKLYVMFTRVKRACWFWCLPLSPAFNKAKLYHLCPKFLATKWRMDIDKSGYWKPHVSNSPALLIPKHQKLVQHVKKKIHWLTYHLKYFLMELPLMIYSLILQSSTEILSIEFWIWLGGNIPNHNFFQQK